MALLILWFLPSDTDIGLLTSRTVREQMCVQAATSVATCYGGQQETSTDVSVIHVVINSPRAMGQVTVAYHSIPRTQMNDRHTVVSEGFQKELLTLQALELIFS